MRRKIDWEGQIGRRLRFRDLHVFFTVANTGSMTKAATVLGVSAPTVSEVIADLEHGPGQTFHDAVRRPHSARSVGQTGRARSGRPGSAANRR